MIWIRVKKANNTADGVCTPLVPGWMIASAIPEIRVIRNMAAIAKQIALRIRVLSFQGNLNTDRWSIKY
jgi:hypothetical protein